MYIDVNIYDKNSTKDEVIELHFYKFPVLYTV